MSEKFNKTEKIDNKRYNSKHMNLLDEFSIEGVDDEGRNTLKSI